MRRTDDTSLPLVRMAMDAAALIPKAANELNVSDATDALVNAGAIQIAKKMIAAASELLVPPSNSDEAVVVAACGLVASISRAKGGLARGAALDAGLMHPLFALLPGGRSHGGSNPKLCLAAARALLAMTSRNDRACVDVAIRCDC